MGNMILDLATLEYLAKSATTVKGLLRMAKKRAQVQHCTKDHRYNGWTNYETWNVALWIDNEESSYRQWNEIAQECYDDAKPDPYNTREENAVYELAKRL